jgi:hypothetical protein
MILTKKNAVCRLMLRCIILDINGKCFTTMTIIAKLNVQIFLNASKFKSCY